MKRTFTDKERFALRLGAGNICEDCGTKLNPGFHADHVIPYSKGGPTKLINGQALCPKCNLTKGNKMEPTINIQHPEANRNWQVNCLTEMKTKFENKKNQFIVSVVPGGGKTRLALAWAKYLIAVDAIDFIVVVSPSIGIKDNWVESAKLFDLTISSTYDTAALRNATLDGIGSKLNGLSLTSSTLANAKEIVEVLCRKRKTLFIVDELHHSADGMSWGDAISHVADSAVFKLGLSGTLTREDTYKIAFMNYDNGVGVSDFSYDYAEAYKDGIVTPLQIETQSGSVTFIDEKQYGPAAVTRDFADEYYKNNSDDEDDTIALNTRLRWATKLPWAEDLITTAHSALVGIRSGNHKTARGIVACRDQAHAEEIFNFLINTLKATAILTTSDTDPDALRIREFKESNDQWLVVVGRAGEGVDIPDARVGALLNVTTTTTSIIQFLGRFIRLYADPKIMPHNEQGALVFTANDQRYIRIAKIFHHAVEHDISGQPAPTKECPKCSHTCPSDAKVCDSCGYSFWDAPIKTCPSCHTEIPKHSQICPDCGYMYPQFIKEGVSSESENGITVSDMVIVDDAEVDAFKERLANAASNNDALIIGISAALPDNDYGYKRGTAILKRIELAKTQV